MATISLGFQLSASAVQMAAGINAGVVELEKLGYAAKKTSQDVAVLKGIEISRAFISTVQAAAGAFSQFIGGTAGAVASIDDLSKRTGITTDVLQAYSLAANQSGVGIETFGKAVQKLTINLGEAQKGNAGAVKSFADLGLSVKDLAAGSPEQAFNSVAAAIAKLPNPAQQAAAAVKVFGKSGIELVPIFQEGATYLQEMTAEAKRLGIVLSPQQTDGITKLDDSLGKTQLTLQAFAARVVAELAPSLTKAAEAASTFIASIDAKQVASAVTNSIQYLASAFQLLATAAAPLAGNILPAIGGYLAFINRQVVTAGLAKLGSVFAAATAATFSYAGAAAAATAATTALAVSVRALLTSTLIGGVVVALGLAAGQAIEWAIASDTATADVTSGVDGSKAAMDAYRKSVAAAALQTEDFGTKSKDALKVPTFTAKDLAQEAIDEANAAVRSLAKELGGLNKVPADILGKFGDLKRLAGGLQTDSVAFADGLALASKGAQSLVTEVRTLTDARKADLEVAKQAADAAKKAAEESRKRTTELAQSGLSQAEQSRLQLNKDLEAIALAVADAERQAAEALAQYNIDAAISAEDRLRTVKEEAAVATKIANEQNRKRLLEARGIDANLLKPTQTIADQMKNLKDAFSGKEINQQEFAQGLRNLAKEGIDIRREIARELSRPASEALKANDIRTSEGISQFMALATGREDPAVRQRGEQLKKLDEIRRAVEAAGAKPVEILGG